MSRSKKNFHQKISDFVGEYPAPKMKKIIEYISYSEELIQLNVCKITFKYPDLSLPCNWEDEWKVNNGQNSESSKDYEEFVGKCGLFPCSNN